MLDVDGDMIELDNPSVKLYNKEPLIELSNLTDAYKWSLKGVNFLKIQTE